MDKWESWAETREKRLWANCDECSKDATYVSGDGLPYCVEHGPLGEGGDWPCDPLPQTLPSDKGSAYTLHRPSVAPKRGKRLDEPFAGSRGLDYSTLAHHALDDDGAPPAAHHLDTQFGGVEIDPADSLDA